MLFICICGILGIKQTQTRDFQTCKHMCKVGIHVTIHYFFHLGCRWTALQCEVVCALWVAVPYWNGHFETVTLKANFMDTLLRMYKGSQMSVCKTSEIFQGHKSHLSHLPRYAHFFSLTSFPSSSEIIPRVWSIDLCGKITYSTFSVPFVK